MLKPLINRLEGRPLRPAAVYTAVSRDGLDRGQSAGIPDDRAAVRVP